MGKIYGVYMAWTKYDVLPDDICDNPNIPVYSPDLARTRIYDNQQAQLDAYANTLCPSSQLFEADTKEEADKKIEEFKKNFQDEVWLKKNIEPYV